MNRGWRDKLAGVNYIIDGHNLISKIPGLSLSMPDDEEQLVELLNHFAKHERGRPLSERAGRLEVYFDGAPPGQAGWRSYGRVKAQFVPASSTADEAIRVRLAKLGKSAGSWVVVSSDHSVQAAAHAVHAGVQKSEEFARRLQASLQSKPGIADRPSDQPLSPAEVDEWLAIFKGRSKV